MTKEGKNDGPKPGEEKADEVKKILEVPEGVTLKEFAEQIEVRTKDLIEFLKKLS